MTAHPPLHLPDVPDVLHHIFSFLDPVHYVDEGAYKSRRSLAMAARTCRGFSGPALDFLWKQLPDDQPLADLLCTLGIAARERERDELAFPSGKKPRRFEIPTIDGPGYYDMLSVKMYEGRWKQWRGYDIRYFLRDAGDPRQHPNWPRFVDYASRVRAIALYVFDGPTWCAIWEELLSATERAPILPKLTSVAFCHLMTQDLCPGAFALISPSVRKLNFSIKSVLVLSPFDEKMRFVFSQSFDAAPQIEKLRLELLPTRIGASLLQAHCVRVRHIEVYPQLDFDDLVALADLPTLQHLSVSLELKPSTPGVASLLVFKSVTTLAIKGIWKEITRALTTMHLPLLHSLTVEGWHYGEPAAELARDATECFRAISGQSSLTSLSISTDYGRLPEDTGGVMYCIAEVEDYVEMPLLDLMHPLLSLSALRDVSISFPVYFTLACTSSDLRAIAESWPSLEALHLLVSEYRATDADSSELSKKYPNGGPLEAIAHFSRNCPRLRILHLSAMEMGQDAVAAAVELLGPAQASALEPHGLNTLVIPQVLLPPGREDLFEKIPELVRAAFPHVKCAFGVTSRHIAEEELDSEDHDNWVYADGCTRRCPVCDREPTPVW